jgi:hypothetical protein
MKRCALGNDLSLAGCLARLEWSPERLAREINRRSGAGTISSKAPYNWLRGARPRRGVSAVVTKILSDQLAEPVTTEELWPARAAPSSAGCPPMAQWNLPRLPELRGTDPDPVMAAVDWLVENPPQVPSQKRGEEVSEVTLDVLEGRVRQLRRLDDEEGAGLVAQGALHDLHWVNRLATQGSYPTEAGVRLYRTAAELAQLAGWLLTDQGTSQELVGVGWACYGLALNAARAAGDRPLAAYVISCMGYRATWDGQATKALRLISIARRGAPEEMWCMGQALLATRQARAYAAVGDEAGCRRALEEAAELGQVSGASHVPSWGYWLNPGVIVADAGRAMVDMGRPRRAERYLERGISMLSGSQPRNLLLHGASLAEARIAYGELDGAAAAVTDAVGLAGRVLSQRARVRLSGLREMFRRYDSAVATEAAEQIGEVLELGRMRAMCARG